MDINDLRAVITIASLAAFLGIVFWAYSGRRKASFDEAARSVIEEDDDPPSPGGSVHKRREARQ